jgi:hypothetical protein
VALLRTGAARLRPIAPRDGSRSASTPSARTSRRPAAPGPSRQAPPGRENALRLQWARPSIIFGLAYEQKKCDSPSEECADGLLCTQALTPFFDFKINKGAQFRVGLPLIRKKVFRDGGEMEEESVDIFSLFAVRLGAPQLELVTYFSPLSGW